ncbi:MAG: DUF2079 domain-containing protein [Flavobacteriales bacterium]
MLAALKSIFFKHYLLLLLLLLFAIHFGLISLVNHQCFRTYALDLGMFSNEMFQYSHFRLPELTLGLKEPMPMLADHWAPILILFSPLRFIFGSYTLLIVQIAGLLFAAIFIYRIALFYQLNKYIATGSSLFFLVMWGITSALAFDFHTNVLAACMFPALYFFLLKQDRSKAILIACIILLTKENMGFWLFFIFAAFWIRTMHLKLGHHRFYISMMALSGIVFYMLVFKVIPSYSQGQHHNLTQFFGHISPDMKEVVWHFISNPLEIFKLFYLDELGNPCLPKTATLFMMFVSGLIFIFWRPWILIMLLPLIAQKFLSGYDQLWGIHGQYSIEFAPIASLALVATLASAKSDIARYLLVAISCHSAAYYNYKVAIPHNERTDVFSKNHYTPAISAGEVEKCRALLPENARLSCSSQLAPHFAFRDSIYHYPIEERAEYIMLITHSFASYPSTGENYMADIEKRANDSTVTVLYRGNDVMLFRKDRSKFP